MHIEKTYFAPAKINLGLSIPFRYQNGFHHIVSIFLPIDLSDEITIKLKPSSTENFSLSWKNQLPKTFHQAKTDLVFSQNFKDNLMYKAWHWIISFLREYNIPVPILDMSVFVKKKIPSPGGLGGASSDAAVIIKAMLEYIKDKVDPIVFESIVKNVKTKSLEIGSDVAFFLHDSACIISGKGEILSNLPPLPFTGILATPGFGVSTPEMFQSLSRPVSDFNRDQITQMAQELSVHDSKKSLQHDNSIVYSLYSNHEKYFRFLDWLINTEDNHQIKFKRYFSVPGELVEDLLHWEGDGTFLIKNDFIEVLQKLNTDKFLALKKIKNILIEKIRSQVDENTGSIILTSMSGSGSTWYAGFPGIDGNQTINKKMDNLVEELQIEFPDIYWQKFCSI